MVTINWDSPLNQNETTINFYDITLRNHDNDTYLITVAASQQIQSYKYAVVGESYYITASIVAVDQCGQRSEASEFQLIHVPVMDGGITNTESKIFDGQTSNTVDILAGVLAVAIAIIITLCIIFVIIIILVCRYFAHAVRKKEEDYSQQEDKYNVEHSQHLYSFRQLMEHDS